MCCVPIHPDLVLIFFSRSHPYIPVHFDEMFFTTCLYAFFLAIFLVSLYHKCELVYFVYWIL